MHIVIKHPQKGFYKTQTVWIPASRAYKHATQFESIIKAEQIAETLTSTITGKPLTHLRIMGITEQVGPVSVYLREQLLKQL